MPAPMRTVLAVAALGAAAAGLTGCSKPTPMVTVVAAGHSVHVPAAVYCRKGSCSQHRVGQPAVSVKAGDVVGVDVDRSIARGQWVVSLDDPSTQQPQVFTRAQDDHYASFLAPGGVTPGTDLLMRVTTAVSETNKPNDETGQWLFTLRVTG